MKTYQTEPPDKKSKIWRWLLGIKFPKKHKHELDVALLKKLQSHVEVANSEASIIENWCARIKSLHINIRASFKQLEPKHLAKLLHDNGNPEIKFEGKMGKRKMQWLLMSQKKKTLRRGRDVIMQKISRNEELNKTEKRLINAEINNHMWYHCPKLTECMNKHCLTASKRQVCTTCKKKTKHCDCAKRMKQVPCEKCKKPYTK